MKDQNIPCVVLMTATITPPKNALKLKRIDPKQREDDYAEALRYYLSIPDQYVKKIIFAENSNSDLSRLKKLVDEDNRSHNKIIEFLEYRDGNNFPPHYGRGYGELKLVDYVLDNSKVLTEDDIIWKVTGRYKLLNITKLIATQPKTFSIYCDLKKYRLNFAYTEAYAFTIPGYRKYLYNKYHKLIIKDEPKGSFNILMSEVAWFNIIYANYCIDKSIFPRLRYAPYFSGVRATSDKSYASIEEKRRYLLRSAFRKIFPNIWT